MPQGIQVFNADGTLQFSEGDRIFRLVGTVNTGYYDGATSVPGAATGTLVVLKTPIDLDRWGHPFVTQSGTTVSWAFDATWGFAERQSCILTFMVY